MTGAQDAPEQDARHKEKMRKRKAAQDRKVAAKTIVKGLLIVHTGRGKGKSTAAFGLVLRALAHGWAIGVVQFIKGAWTTGERQTLEMHFPDLVSWHAMGEGFTWETQDRARDIAAAESAWAKAKALMDDPNIRLVVLDELNVALRYDYLPVDGVVAALTQRRPDLHVVVTGRNAPPALIEAADLVTDMTPVKHHFDAGVKAQAGIEF
jgi:cob(I)alamin adenosyltransferase